MSIDRQMDAVFKALANPTRRAICDALRDRPLTTGQLAAQFAHLDRCTVMQHLAVLEKAELVIAARRGRERFNHLNAVPIQQIHERWIGPHAAIQATVRLMALKSALEAEETAQDA